ncbi:MAG: hypothetical protein ACQESC_01885 [Nanobdellota archaeon]
MKYNAGIRIVSFMFLVLILFSLFAVVSSAFGIAPSRYSFNEGDEKDISEFKVRILNTHDEELFLELKPTGDIADYISLEKNMVSLSPSDSEAIVFYTIDLPEELKPGSNTGAIEIIDVSGHSVSGESKVTANVGVKQTITILSPYPRQYIEGDFFISSSTLDKPVDFSLHLKNKGSVSSTVSGSIVVKTALNEEVARFPIPKTLLSSLSAKKITTDYSFENDGVYSANAYINYGSKQFTLSKQFMVGNKEVIASDMNVDSFDLGEIALLRILIDNRWNDIVDDVYAKVSILNEEGSVVDMVETNPVSVKAHDSAQLKAYWDTSGIDIGTYDVVVKLFYDDIVSRYYFDALVNANSIELSKEGVSGNVVDDSSSDDSLSLSSIVILLVFALIFINVFWFVIVKKKINK